MRLHEHEAARLFQQAGVPVASFAVARTADEAVAALTKVELPVVIKAQLVYSVETEMARTVEDITDRRLSLSYRGPVAGRTLSAIAGVLDKK